MNCVICPVCCDSVVRESITHHSTRHRHRLWHLEHCTWWGRCFVAALPSGRWPKPFCRRSSSWGCSRSWWWRPAVYWACSPDSAAPAGWTAALCVCAYTLMRWKRNGSFISRQRYPLFRKQKNKTFDSSSCRKRWLTAKAHRVQSFNRYYFSPDPLLSQQQFYWEWIPLCLWNSDCPLSDTRFVLYIQIFMFQNSTLSIQIGLT